MDLKVGPNASISHKEPRFALVLDYGDADRLSQVDARQLTEPLLAHLPILLIGIDFVFGNIALNSISAACLDSCERSTLPNDRIISRILLCYVTCEVAPSCPEFGGNAE